MSEPVWKLVKNPRTGEENIVFRQWDDGKQESCSIYDQAYLKWLSEGNTPLPAEGTE